MFESSGFSREESSHTDSANSSQQEMSLVESSDAQQLAYRNEQAVARLHSLRASIDNIDAALVHMLAERFKCTQEVGKLKATYAMPASDPDREARQIARLKQLATDAKLDPEFAEKWFNFVVAEVIQHHKQIAAEN